MTLSSIRTEVHGFKRRCSTHWATESVGRSWILILIRFVIFNYIYLYIYTYNKAVLINICRFLINVVKLCKPLSKLDLQTFRKGSAVERTQRNKWKNLTLPRTRSQVLGFSSADALPTKLRLPVGRTWMLIRISFQVSNPFRRFLFFMLTFFIDIMSC